MREPILKEAGKGKKAGKGVAKAVPGGRAARPSLRRILGGKALARLLYFARQREDIETEDNRKALSKGPNKALIRSTGRRRATTRPSIGKGKDAAASPFLAAFTHQENLKAMTAPAAPVRQSWRPLGPFSVPHGQTYGEGVGSRPSVSGRISSIAIDPGNASHILIGAAGGGVWESRDTGNTWSPRTDDQPSLAIGVVAFDPGNPSIVYAGTGEGDSTFVDKPNLLGVGLLRSTDGGTTWGVLASDPFVKTGFYDLVIDPLNSSHLLAATTIGLFESTNGGTIWKQRRAFRTWDLSMRPAVSGDSNSTKEVFAACVDGLYRSANGGATWNVVNLPGAPGEFDRIEVCHAPSDGNVVYVIASGPPDILDPVESRPGKPVKMSTPYLWRRSVSGGAFVAFKPPPDLQTGQAWYDWFAAVAPNNPDVLYVGGINVHKGIRSATGNWTWTNISAKSNGDSIHPDQHAIAFSPADPNIVYVGNDGGIYRSPDGGTRWRSLNKGLCITEIEFMAQHPQFESWLLAGTQDNGTMRYQGEEVWYHISDGDGGDCGINASSPFTCYHTFYGMGMVRSNRGGGWDTWTDELIGPPADTDQDYPDGALFYPPLEVNGRVIVQAGRTVFISSDGGTNWVGRDLPGNAGWASAITIPTTTRIYVGTDESGRVFRIDLAGGTWGTPVQLTRLVAGFISDILVDPTNPNRIYVTYSSLKSELETSHVFRSDNAGTSWSAASDGLPNIAANAIEIDPQNPDTIYVAADVGVYRSTDAGASWTPFNYGLPNALVKDLVFHQPSRLLRAGTQARGVWEIAVDEAMMPDVEIYLRDSAVDTGRLLPSPSGVNDPFNFGAQTFWFQCTDIKVDSPSFVRPLITDVDFELFEDDQSMIENGIQFAAGLTHENPQRNRTVRVFVQVHNRGVKPATNIAVKVFFTPSSGAFPDLPDNFWANFPSNMLPADSLWQPIASHKVLPSVEGGRSEIVGFEWAVPGTSASSMALLAIISADNDSIQTTELNIQQLVTNNKKCGLRNLTVVNPSPVVGPAVKAVQLDLFRSGDAKTFSLEADQNGASLLRSIVLSKRLSKLAKKSKLKKIKLDNDDKMELARMVESSPALKKQLDLKSAYAPRKGVWLESFKLDHKKPEPIVLLVKPKPRAGYGSVIQKSGDGTVVGGFTLQAGTDEQ